MNKREYFDFENCIFCQLESYPKSKHPHLALSLPWKMSHLIGLLYDSTYLFMNEICYTNYRLTGSYDVQCPLVSENQIKT